MAIAILTAAVSAITVVRTTRPTKKSVNSRKLQKLARRANRPTKRYSRRPRKMAAHIKTINRFRRSVRKSNKLIRKINYHLAVVATVQFRTPKLRRGITERPILRSQKSQAQPTKIDSRAVTQPTRKAAPLPSILVALNEGRKPYKKEQPFKRGAKMDRGGRRLSAKSVRSFSKKGKAMKKSASRIGAGILPLSSAVDCIKLILQRNGWAIKTAALNQKDAACVDYPTKTIYISSAISPEEAAIALTHEAVHVIQSDKKYCFINIPSWVPQDKDRLEAGLKFWEHVKNTYNKGDHSKEFAAAILQYFPEIVLSALQVKYPINRTTTGGRMMVFNKYAEACGIPEDHKPGYSLLVYNTGDLNLREGEGDKNRPIYTLVLQEGYITMTGVGGFLFGGGGAKVLDHQGDLYTAVLGDRKKNFRGDLKLHTLQLAVRADVRGKALLEVVKDQLIPLHSQIHFFGREIGPDYLAAPKGKSKYQGVGGLVLNQQFHVEKVCIVPSNHELYIPEATWGDRVYNQTTSSQKIITSSAPTFVSSSEVFRNAVPGVGKYNRSKKEAVPSAIQWACSHIKEAEDFACRCDSEQFVDWFCEQVRSWHKPVKLIGGDFYTLLCGGSLTPKGMEVMQPIMQALTVVEEVVELKTLDQEISEDEEEDIMDRMFSRRFTVDYKLDEKWQERIQNVIALFGYNLQYQSLLDIFGYCDTNSMCITVDSSLKKDTTILTLTHEAVHMLLHTARAENLSIPGFTVEDEAAFERLIFFGMKEDRRNKTKEAIKSVLQSSDCGDESVAFHFMFNPQGLEALAQKIHTMISKNHTSLTIESDKSLKIEFKPVVLPTTNETPSYDLSFNVDALDHIHLFYNEDPDTSVSFNKMLAEHNFFGMPILDALVLGLAKPNVFKPTDPTFAKLLGDLPEDFEGDYYPWGELTPFSTVPPKYFKTRVMESHADVTWCMASLLLWACLEREGKKVLPITMYDAIKKGVPVFVYSTLMGEMFEILRSLKLVETFSEESELVEGAVAFVPDDFKTPEGVIKLTPADLYSNLWIKSTYSEVSGNHLPILRALTKDVNLKTGEFTLNGFGYSLTFTTHEKGFYCSNPEWYFRNNYVVNGQEYCTSEVVTNVFLNLCRLGLTRNMVGGKIRAGLTELLQQIQVYGTKSSANSAVEMNKCGFIQYNAIYRERGGLILDFSNFNLGRNTYAPLAYQYNLQKKKPVFFQHQANWIGEGIAALSVGCSNFTVPLLSKGRQLNDVVFVASFNEMDKAAKGPNRNTLWLRTGSKGTVVYHPRNAFIKELMALGNAEMNSPSPLVIKSLNDEIAQAHGYFDSIRIIKSPLANVGTSGATASSTGLILEIEANLTAQTTIIGIQGETKEEKINYIRSRVSAGLRAGDVLKNGDSWLQFMKPNGDYILTETYRKGSGDTFRFHVAVTPTISEQDIRPEGSWETATNAQVTIRVEGSHIMTRPSYVTKSTCAGLKAAAVKHNISGNVFKDLYSGSPVVLHSMGDHQKDMELLKAGKVSYAQQVGLTVSCEAYKGNQIGIVMAACQHKLDKGEDFVVSQKAVTISNMGHSSESYPLWPSDDQVDYINQVTASQLGKVFILKAYPQHQWEVIKQYNQGCPDISFFTMKKEGVTYYLAAHTAECRTGITLVTNELSSTEENQGFMKGKLYPESLISLYVAQPDIGAIAAATGHVNVEVVELMKKVLGNVPVENQWDYRTVLEFNNRTLVEVMESLEDVDIQSPDGESQFVSFKLGACIGMTASGGTNTVARAARDIILHMAVPLEERDGEWLSMMPRYVGMYRSAVEKSMIEYDESATQGNGISTSSGFVKQSSKTGKIMSSMKMRGLQAPWVKKDEVYLSSSDPWAGYYQHQYVLHGRNPMSLFGFAQVKIVGPATDACPNPDIITEEEILGPSCLYIDAFILHILAMSDDDGDSAFIISINNLARWASRKSNLDHIRKLQPSLARRIQNYMDYASTLPKEERKNVVYDMIMNQILDLAPARFGAEPKTLANGRIVNPSHQGLASTYMRYGKDLSKHGDLKDFFGMPAKKDLSRLWPTFNQLVEMALETVEVESIEDTSIRWIISADSMKANYKKYVGSVCTGDQQLELIQDTITHYRQLCVPSGFRNVSTIKWAYNLAIAHKMFDRMPNHSMRIWQMAQIVAELEIYEGPLGLGGTNTAAIDFYRNLQLAGRYGTIYTTEEIEGVSVEKAVDAKQVVKETWRQLINETAEVKDNILTAEAVSDEVFDVYFLCAQMGDLYLLEESGNLTESHTELQALITEGALGLEGSEIHLMALTAGLLRRFAQGRGLTPDDPNSNPEEEPIGLYNKLSSLLDLYPKFLEHKNDPVIQMANQALDIFKFFIDIKSVEDPSMMF